MPSTVAHIDDHEVGMELDAERRRRLTSSVTTLSICSDTVKQRMIPGGSNDKRLTNTESIGTTSFMPTYICHPLVIAIAACASVAALMSWLIYKCSDTVEQSVIAGGSNERLTNVDTHNCYIYKVAQYLASCEAFLYVHSCML